MIDTSPTWVVWKDHVYLWPYFETINRILETMCDNFFEMRDEAPNDSDPVNSTFDRLMKNVEFLSAYVFKLNPDVGNCYIDTALHNMYHFVILLTEMLPQLSMEENLRFSEWLKSFVTATKDYRDICGFLHHACKTNSAYSVDLVKLFLEAGADPNARNSYGKPPFSVAKSSLHSIRDVANFVRKTQLLVAAGAHLDLCIGVDSNELTPLEWFKLLYGKYSSPILKSFIDSLPVQRLTCLCAQTIRANRVPYDHQDVPSVLVSFLENQGAYSETVDYELL